MLDVPGSPLKFGRRSLERFIQNCVTKGSEAPVPTPARLPLPRRNSRRPAAALPPMEWKYLKPPPGYC